MKKILLVTIFGVTAFVVISVVHAEPADSLIPSENVFDTLSVDLKVNGNDGPVNVSIGERITISWESDGAKRCKGNWSKNDLRLNGKISGKLSRSLTGSITVRIACIDADGNRDDDSVVLKITGDSPIPPTPPILPIAPTWMIVFTHRGTPLPENVVSFICNSVKSTVISWLDRELGKYNKQRPFGDIICYQDQILLSTENLLKGDLMWGEGVTFTNPINDRKVIEFLENKILSIKQMKYVTVFHYLVPTNLQFADHAYGEKYDFEFITSFTLLDGTTAFNPPLSQPRSVDDYAQELIHEFMHKIGATDKYSVDPKQACLINYETNQQYNGYDIMCHRISALRGDGFATPSITELMITAPTHKELKLIN